MENREVKWLYEEMPSLVAKGVISEETMQSLKDHYGDIVEEKENPNISFIITSTVGAILVAAGIIAIIAHNWDNFGRVARTAFSILPLLIAQVFYGYAYFKKKDSVAWLESTSGFLVLMILSSLALISQTYNLGGELRDLLLLWGILIIPLLYLRRVILPFVFFMVCISWRAIEVNYGIGRVENVLTYSFFISASLPFLYSVFSKSTPNAGKTIVGWSLLIGTAVSAPFLFNINASDGPLLYAALCTLYYVLGKYFYEKESHFWLRPFQTAAIVGVYYLSLLYTYNWLHSWYGMNAPHHDKATIIAIVLFTVVSILFTVLLIRKRSYINIFPASAVLVISLLQLLSEKSNHIPVEIISNLFLLAYGIYYVWNGISSKKIYLVNLGMFFIASLAIARFFESDLNFLVKGIGFILVGLGFLSANIFINRSMKKNETAIQ